MKNKLKRILDIVMTLMLPCLMAYLPGPDTQPGIPLRISPPPQW